MQNTTKQFIYILYETKKFKYEKQKNQQKYITTKKIVENIYNQFLTQEPKFNEFILLNEDQAFTEESKIDFIKYNQTQFALIKPSETVKALLAKKEFSDQQKYMDLLKNKNEAQNKAALISLIAKATNAKEELKIKKPVCNQFSLRTNCESRSRMLINNNAISVNNLVSRANNSNNINNLMVDNNIRNNNIFMNINNRNINHLTSRNALMSNPFEHSINQNTNSIRNLNLRNNFNSNPGENEELTEEEKFDECISILIGMGFDCEEAVSVLRLSKNNLDIAIEILVNPRRNNA